MSLKNKLRRSGLFLATIQGFGFLFDLSASRAPKGSVSATPWEDDLRALAGDWQAVGNDLRTAQKQYRRELMRHEQTEEAKAVT